MQKNTMILVATTVTLALSGFKVISAEETSATQAKSIAWYVANVKDAQIKNQLCHDNPALQSSEDCKNALHALQISFNGGN